MKKHNTIAPLPINLIKEYFADKEMFFVIDYKKSQLKDKVFLTYLSNLDIPSDVSIGDDVTEDELFALIEAYMTIKTVNDIELLKMAVTHIILKAKGADTSELVVNPILTEEQVDVFILKHQSIIDRWIHFLDSTMLYLIYIYTDLNAEVKVEDNYPVIDDVDYVGLNIVNLFTVSGFMEYYFTVSPSDTMSFFTRQFTEHMFRGKSLLPYYNNEKNMFIPILIAMVESKIPLNPSEVFSDETVGED